MNKYISAVFRLAILWTHLVSASPHAQLQAPSNLSHPTYLCYEAADSRLPVTIPDCRASLRILREMPKYRLVQEFQRNKKPLIPILGSREVNAPPFIIEAEDSICALEITDAFPGLIDKFSFAQVKDLATNILEECATSYHEPGYGGQYHVGAMAKWRVKVFGVNEDTDGAAANGTSIGGAVGDDVILVTHVTYDTTVPEPLVDADTTLAISSTPELASG